MAKTKGRPRTGSRSFDTQGNIVTRISVDGARVSIPLSKKEGEVADALEKLVIAYCDELVANGTLQPSQLRPALIAVLSRIPDTVTLKQLPNLWQMVINSKVAIEASKVRTKTTFQDVAEMWLSGELYVRFPGMRKRTGRGIEQARQKLEDFVFPIIGGLPIEQVGDREVIGVIEAARKTGRLAEVSLVALFDICRRVISLAHSPLKLIDHVPLGPMHRPVAQRRQQAQLTPKDDLHLLQCTDVSIHDRIWWGALAREGTRVKEMLALKWSALTEDDVLQVWHGKTRRFTRWEIDAATARGLRLYRQLCGNPGPDEFIFHPTSKTQFAFAFRRDLEKAGFKERRPELWINDDRQKQVVAHCLRALFVTVSLAAGKPDKYIRQRTAHCSERMQETYEQDVDLFREKGWKGLGALDETIPELAAVARGETIAAHQLPIRILRAKGSSLSKQERREAYLKVFRQKRKELEARGHYSRSRSPAYRRAQRREKALLATSAMVNLPKLADASKQGVATNDN